MRELRHWPSIAGKFISYIVFTFSQFLDLSFDVKWDNSGAKLD